MQHYEVKCRKCGGYVVGKDSIASMRCGVCSHCLNVGKKKTFKTEEQRVKERAHRQARLADRALKNQQCRKQR